MIIERRMTGGEHRMDLNELKTPEDLAIEWGLTARRVQFLCQEGRIEGAVKKGRQWLLPSDAKKPERLKTGPKAGSHKAGMSDR